MHELWVLLTKLISLGWQHRTEVIGIVGSTTVASMFMQKIKKWLSLETATVKYFLSATFATLATMIPLAISLLQNHVVQLQTAGIHVGVALAVMQPVYLFVKWAGSVMDDVKAGRITAPVTITTVTPSVPTTTTVTIPAPTTTVTSSTPVDFTA